MMDYWSSIIRFVYKEKGLPFSLTHILRTISNSIHIIYFLRYDYSSNNINSIIEQQLLHYFV